MTAMLNIHTKLHKILPTCQKYFTVHQKYNTLLISFCLGTKLKSEPVIRHRMMNILKSGAVTLQL